MKESLVYQPLFWKRCVLVFITVSLFWYWYSGLMVFDVWDSPFNYKGADLTYWLVDLTGIPKLICTSLISAYGFCFVLILSFIASIFFIQSRVLTIIAGILLLIYQIVLNMKLGYHTHHLFPYQFALLPFYCNIKIFHISSAFARILVCLTYFFAGIFKLKGLAWLDTHSFSNTIQNQLSAYFYFNPDDFRSIFALTLSHYPIICWVLFGMAMCLQLSFFLGFISRKYDKMFVFFILIFHLMDWFLMNLGVFMSMTILCYLFIIQRRTEDLSLCQNEKINIPAEEIEF